MLIYFILFFRIFSYAFKPFIVYTYFTYTATSITVIDDVRKLATNRIFNTDL